MGIWLLRQNISRGMENLQIALDGDLPIAFHTMGEIIQFGSIEIPGYYLELYNLTTRERKCEVSTNFYARSVLRGYLKSWLMLAEKRYVLEDFQSSYLLYAYSSFLGLPQGSFSAGYSWQKMKTSSLK